jgi:hypothetical protein
MRMVEWLGQSEVVAYNRALRIFLEDVLCVPGTTNFTRRARIGHPCRPASLNRGSCVIFVVS